MRIINIPKKRILYLIFIVITLSYGCNNKLDRVQSLSHKSQLYYRKAVSEYKKLITKGKNLDRLYFELGLLYYQNREFPLAIEALKKSSDEKALKFLAICYYLNGDFTDALELFQKSSFLDDESLYYYGLTCERLNLFDEALKVYKKIKEKSFKEKANQRIYLIERQTHSLNIKEISPQVYEILKNAPSSQDYPQAGALILYCDEEIQVTNQRTQISSLHYIIKILNERGKENFSEAHIDYDSTYEKIELEYARTIKPDGTVVEVGSKHIRDVSKYLNFPLYSNVRVFIISFPEVAEDVVIEYKLKVYRNQLINKKDVIIAYSLQSEEPIMHAEFTVRVPKDNPLNIKFINEEYNNFKAELKPQLHEEADYLIYYWQFKNLPQMLPESNMPPSTELNPTILLSSFDYWQEIYDWWWDLAKDKISADKAIKQKVEELTKNLVDEEQKVKAIYNFCAQQIRYVAVEYGQAGYEPHSAQDIFRNKYGDCKDQAILLVTMLREAGIPSWPVLIGTKQYYNLNEDFPALFFNHCIAQAQVKNKFIFLDPTCQTCSFGDLPDDDQARKVLVIRDDKYQIESTPLYGPEHNLIEQNLNIKINPEEGITATKTVIAYGAYNQAQRAWLLYTPPELIQDILKEKIQQHCIGANLEEYGIQNLDNLNLPVILRYSFKGQEYLIPAGNLRIFPQLVMFDSSFVAKERRRYDIDFDFLYTQKIFYEIEIPAGFLIKYIPDNIIEDNPWFKFNVEYNYHNNKIYFTQRMELKKNRISKGEYLSFKHRWEDLARKAKQRIILQKTNEGL